ncbi:MAG TPA: DciA family protein [Steroidobacteraceae bacterium]|nr:DciA family protein [Steroidobacteraceae bacterium]
MQKKPPGDKANTGRSSRITPTRRPQSRNSLDSVKDLLQRATPVLAGLQREALRQRDWLQWVRRELPEDLAGHVTGVAEQAGELVIFAESAVWGVRLRYAAPQLLEAMDAARMKIGGVRVRVVPRTAPPA